MTWWKNRDKVCKKNRSQVWWIPIALVSLVVGIAGFIFVSWLIETFFLPSDWLFYEYSIGLSKVFILLIMTFLILLFGKLARLLRLSWKYLLALTESCILLMALLISTTTAVTNNRIIEINLIVPSKEFVYSDVKSVWTGFGTKLFTLDETKRQGTFSYCIDLDGEEKVFMQPTVNQKLVSDDT